MEKNGKIGVFDSGFGGLTVLKEFKKILPQYDYVYLGDNARAPYGSRSHQTIFEYTKEGVEFLFQNGAEIIVLACNSASAEALRKIQQEFLPEKYPDRRVLGVIIPTAEEATLETERGKVAILATEATVHSGTFEREIEKIDPRVKVFSFPAPLLVPIVENGEEKSAEAEEFIKKYVEEAKNTGADILILGCTHYGFLKEAIAKYAPLMTIVEEAPIVARKFEDYLLRHADIKEKLSHNGSVEFFTTDNSEKFDTLGKRFLGSEITSKKITLENL